MYIKILDHWFWWYLFQPPDDKNYTSWWSRFRCRWNFHPCGSVYYNPGGFEPDDSCKNCGDLI